MGKWDCPVCLKTNVRMVESDPVLSDGTTVHVGPVCTSCHDQVIGGIPAALAALAVPAAAPKPAAAPAGAGKVAATA